MPAPRGLVQQLDQELHKSGLLPREATLLLAVSGGADSVAMLRLMHRINQSDYWQWKLIVGHVDHGIRGRASRADAKFVKELAARLGVPCVIRTLRLGGRASEQAARVARHRTLEAMASARRCYAVVMAHHADDQAETVLLRLFRGAGLEGLAGIATDTTVNGMRILRPLLGLRRDELRDYLGQLRQGFREDASNASDRYTRNRLRKDVLPAIAELAPGAMQAIIRTASLVRQAQHLVESDLRHLLAEAVILRTPRRVHLDRERLRAADAFLCSMALRDAIVHVGGSTESADFERLREAVRIVCSTAGDKEVELGRGVHLHVTCSAVSVWRRSE
ncbi:MAG: tRNA lysidine(34) synthetase TilS [Phycisphaerales bacterium]|nr:tRNA lysidine(34) synthetase TilS [Phycisphaerales bacterium]